MNVQCQKRWNVSPACQDRVDDEYNVSRLLADGSTEVVVAPLADQQQLCQAGGEDGAAQQGAAEDERQEEAVVPLHSTNRRSPSVAWWTSGVRSHK